MSIFKKKPKQESPEIKILRQRLSTEDDPDKRYAILKQIAILKDKINY